MAGFRKNSRGFTLIELMIVISMMMILIAIAIPAYLTSIVRAREGVLKQNLFTLRSLLSQYTLDKQQAPQALDDLVTAGVSDADTNAPHTLKPEKTAVRDG